MGRHTAERRSLFSPARNRVKAAATRLGVSENVAPKSIRRTWGFTLTAALSLVTVIDPYFGSISATAAKVEYVDYFEVAEKAEPVKVSLTRGGYEVLSGADAVKVFVELAVVPSADTVQAIAYGKMAKFGWGIDQYSCLVKLWNRESNWRVNAYNKSSGAYGIPQSLPGNKMATAGADWLTNPETQINWGLGYIEGRYGNPCAALAHSDRVNWY
jgi:hypothetical protein